MLVSLKEVRKYVDLNGLTPEEIANKLTDAGIEVEEIKYLSTATNLVIGEVLSCINHPSSDHLHLCKVDIKDEILDIVCGAPNCRKGLKVIVAKVGSKLPGGEIKESIIRGEPSKGMLCSLKELGVEDKYLTLEQINGIEELPSDAKVGDTNVLSYLGLDDVILNLKLLANRSDCLAIYNISREIGALFNRKVNIPTYNDKIDCPIDFKVGSTTSKCKVFTGTLFKNITVKESPRWLKEFLRSEGIRSINNVVDVGNYIMLLTGQPVHMYDLDKLPANELIVKDNFETDLVALDDKTYHLLPNDLVVTSKDTPVCIAGIMGLKNVEVDENSKNIILEVASFYGANVRKTSARLGLSSDSSLRYVKGVDTLNVTNVINLTNHLFKEIIGVKELYSSAIYNVDERKLLTLECSVDYINKRLATNFSFEEIKEVLNKLYFTVENIDNNNFKVTPPSFRIDVETKADISEEIIRYKGFSYIKESLPVMETTIGGRSIEQEKTYVLKEYLLNIGLNEVLTYTLLNESDNNKFNYLNNDEAYQILNPLTEDHKYVRRNLLSSMLNVTEYNLSHLNRNFGLFEISKCESKNNHETHLAISLSGEKYGLDLYQSKKYDVLDLKGILLAIFNLFNVSTSRIKFETLSDSKEFHPYRSLKVYLDNKLIGVLGEVHPKIKEHFNFNKDSLCLLELNLTKLFNTKTSNNKSVEYSKYPLVSRDYALLVDENVAYQNIVKELKKASNYIKNIELFDLYKGSNIKEGKVSIALSITLEKLDNTFTNEEINQIDAKVKDVIVNKIKGELRS